MLWRTSVCGHVAISKKLTVLSWTRTRKPSAHPSASLSSHPSASNSGHKLGTRDQKSWRGKPRQDLRRSGQSRFPSRGIPRRYLFSAVLRGISRRFPDLEALLLKLARRSTNTLIHIFHLDVTFGVFVAIIPITN